MTKQFVLQPCFFMYYLRHTNMTGKAFKLFDECAARGVHLSPQEEERTSSSWRDSKLYTFGSIANSQEDAN